MGARLLVVSNGMRHFCCLMSPDGYRFLREIPVYADLLRLTSGDVKPAPGK